MITSYSGSIQDGTLHGRGCAEYANNEKFEGDWVYGKRHGQVSDGGGEGERRKHVNKKDGKSRVELLWY